MIKFEIICFIALLLILVGAYNVLMFSWKVVKYVYNHFKQRAIDRKVEKSMKEEFGL